MPFSQSTRILVTGACGQIGTELTAILRERHGNDNVVASDIQPVPPVLAASGPSARLDVTQREALVDVVQRYHIDTIDHRAAILAAAGEEKPRLAWSVNIGGLHDRGARGEKNADRRA